MLDDIIEEHTQADVAIFGGGLAGARLARLLSAHFDVTLVDPNDHVEIPMAAPRCAVDPALARQSIIPYVEVAPQARHVRGKLVSMGLCSGLVEHSDGGRILVGGRVNVLSTGNHHSSDLFRASGYTVAERLTRYDETARRIGAAGNILIVGGGPIGIEVAGEIIESFPRTAVTLVASGPRILEGTSAEAAEVAHKFLNSKGVKILTGQRVVRTTTHPEDPKAAGGEAETSTGSRIPYDLVLWCTGGQPNTHYMKPHLANALDPHGRVRVSSSLRALGHPRLFAIGDINDLDENKMAWHLEAQIDRALVNIKRVLAGRIEEQDLVRHHARTGDRRMAVTLGSRQGVLHLPVIGVVRSPWMTRQAKAAHMLVPKYRKLLRG